ncbi:MAG: sodium:proton antiporter [Desulfurococcales archaeon ex4484_58]|nr:MAG: sodium:proton antiporter [Desulfurococcales archaeon ex4484_58]
MIGKIISYNNPIDLTIAVTINLVIALLVLTIIYWILKPGSRRVTTVYLAGEGEEIVSSFSPSPLNLYWGFIKRFAKTIYKYLLEAMHTGDIHDWISYMVSWYGILILASLIILITYIVAR